MTGLNEALSSSDRVVEAIVRGIRHGRLVPGQRLVESDLTASLGVSRGPVREALKRLAAEGLVKLSRHKGAYVSALSRRDAADLLLVLEVLTGLIVRLAAETVRCGADTNHLREVFAHLGTYRTGRAEDIASSQDRAHFYDTLIDIGGNRQIDRIRPSMQIQLLRQQIQPYLTPQDRQNQLTEYAAITQAVLAGDAKAAQRAMQRHMRQARNRIERSPDEAFTPPEPNERT